MKRLFTITLVSLLSFSAFADESHTDAIENHNENRNFFWGTRFIFSSFKVPTLSDGTSKNIKLNTRGMGYSFGGKFSGNFGFDIEGLWGRLGILGQKENNYMTNISIVPSLRYGHEFFGFLEPYIGVGLGPSLWLNEIQYTKVVVGPLYTETISATENTTKFNLAYSVKAGININIWKMWALNFSAKYQNLGRVKNRINAFDISGDIINTEYSIGILYKF